MSKVFLSIDLDYWTYHKYGSKKPFISCKKFFDKVFSLNKPIVLVKHHHTLIKTINKIPDLDMIVNVDYHSDICSAQGWRARDLGPGCWANFAKSKKTFLWIYPHADCAKIPGGDGYCHDPWNNSTNPFAHPISGWEHVKKINKMSAIPWDDIVSIGICLSPDYTEEIDNVKAPLIRMGMWDWALKIIDEEYRGFGNIKDPHWSNNHKTYQITS
jgi:hypothetical protein